MTAIFAVSCGAGLAVSADSSMAHERDVTEQLGGVMRTTRQLITTGDAGAKLTLMRGRFIVAMGGAHLLPPPLVLAHLAELVDQHDPRPTLGAFGEALTVAAHEHLRHVQASLQAGAPGAPVQLPASLELLVAGLDERGWPRVLQFFDGALRYNDGPHDAPPRLGVYPLGFHEGVTGRLLDESAIPFASYSLQQAVDLSRWCVQTMIDLQRFEASKPMVAGPIWSAVVDREGARWVHRPALVAREFGLAQCAHPQQ